MVRLVLAAFIPVLAACGGGGGASAPAATEQVQVIATNSVLADLARNVAGDSAEVRTLVPPGVDPHSFQTTPGHSRDIGEAGLIISNGAGLDDFLQPVLEAAMKPGAVHIELAEGLTESASDPHFWQDPLLAVGYVERIAEGLAQVDPGRAVEYQARGVAYATRLRQLDREIEGILSQVPRQRRHLVTYHNAFSHFGQRYGWKVSAFASSDAADVTPGAVVALMDQAREEGIPAVFAAPQLSPDVLRQVAQDSNITVGRIYTLADDDVPTYIDMLLANANNLAQHLK